MLTNFDIKIMTGAEVNTEKLCPEVQRLTLHNWGA